MSLEHVSFRRPVQSEFALLCPTEILRNVLGISDVFDHDVGRLGMVQVVILLVCETGDLLFEPESVAVEFRHDILAAVVPAVEKRKVHDDGRRQKRAEPSGSRIESLVGVHFAQNHVLARVKAGLRSRRVVEPLHGLVDLFVLCWVFRNGRKPFWSIAGQLEFRRISFGGSDISWIIWVIWGFWRNPAFWVGSSVEVVGH